MEKEYSLSVIVPVYNEIELVEESLVAINSFAENHFGDYEIIVVESGSTDGTAQVCDGIAQSNPRIKVIHEGARNGFGSALRLGYEGATKELLWLVTVDLPFPLETILRALPLLSKYDCVLSYRIKDRRRAHRKIQSFIYNMIVKGCLGLKAKHVNSGFKVFKKDVVENMTLRSNGWFVDAEILYRLKEKSISYVEIPVEVMDRSKGRSSVNCFSPFLVLWELLAFIASVRRVRQPGKVGL